ncbi:unnamed protein product [Umbelopsis vinacea]
MLNLALVSGALISVLAEQVLSIVAILCFTITATAQIVAMGETWYPKGATLNRAYGIVRLGCAILAILGIVAIGVALSNKQVILPTSIAGGLSIATNSFSLSTLWASIWYTWQPTHVKVYFLTKDYQKHQRRAQDAWRLRCFIAILSLYTIITIVVMALSAQYNNAAESAWLWISCQISVPSSWAASTESDLDHLEEQQHMHVGAPDIRKLSPTPDGGSHIPLQPPPPVPAHGYAQGVVYSSPEHNPAYVPAQVEANNNVLQQEQPQPDTYDSHYMAPKKPTLLLPPVLNANDMAYRIPSMRISAISMSNAWSNKDNNINS